MSEVRYYLDEHVAKAVAIGMRRRHVDVMTSSEAGTLGADDAVHLASALALRRVVFTQDTDFLSLAGRGHVHSGIVYARQHTPIGRIVDHLVLIHHTMSAEEMVGKIEYI